MNNPIKRIIAILITFAFIFTQCGIGIAAPVYNKVGQNLRVANMGDPGRKADAAGFADELGNKGIIRKTTGAAVGKVELKYNGKPIIATVDEDKITFDLPIPKEKSDYRHLYSEGKPAPNFERVTITRKGAHPGMVTVKELLLQKDGEGEYEYDVARPELYNNNATRKEKFATVISVWSTYTDQQYPNEITELWMPPASKDSVTRVSDTFITEAAWATRTSWRVDRSGKVTDFRHEIVDFNAVTRYQPGGVRANRITASVSPAAAQPAVPTEVVAATEQLIFQFQSVGRMPNAQVFDGPTGNGGRFMTFDEVRAGVKNGDIGIANINKTTARFYMIEQPLTAGVGQAAGRLTDKQKAAVRSVLASVDLLVPQEKQLADPVLAEILRLRLKTDELLDDKAVTNLDTALSKLAESRLRKNGLIEDSDQFALSIVLSKLAEIKARVHDYAQGLPKSADLTSPFMQTLSIRTAIEDLQRQYLNEVPVDISPLVIESLINPDEIFDPSLPMPTAAEVARDIAEGRLRVQLIGDPALLNVKVTTIGSVQGYQRDLLERRMEGDSSITSLVVIKSRVYENEACDYTLPLPTPYELARDIAAGILVVKLIPEDKEKHQKKQIELTVRDMKRTRDAVLKYQIRHVGQIRYERTKQPAVARADGAEAAAKGDKKAASARVKRGRAFLQAITEVDEGMQREVDRKNRAIATKLVHSSVPIDDIKTTENFHPFTEQKLSAPATVVNFLVANDVDPESEPMRMMAYHIIKIAQEMVAARADGATGGVDKIAQNLVREIKEGSITAEAITRGDADQYIRVALREVQRIKEGGGGSIHHVGSALIAEVAKQDIPGDGVRSLLLSRILDVYYEDLPAPQTPAAAVRISPQPVEPVAGARSERYDPSVILAAQMNYDDFIELVRTNPGQLKMRQLESVHDLYKRGILEEIFRVDQEMTRTLYLAILVTLQDNQEVPLEVRQRAEELYQEVATARAEGAHLDVARAKQELALPGGKPLYMFIHNNDVPEEIAFKDAEVLIRMGEVGKTEDGRLYRMKPFNARETARALFERDATGEKQEVVLYAVPGLAALKATIITVSDAAMVIETSSGEQQIIQFGHTLYLVRRGPETVGNLSRALELSEERVNQLVRQATVEEIERTMPAISQIVRALLIVLHEGNMVSHVDLIPGDTNPCISIKLRYKGTPAELVILTDTVRGKYRFSLAINGESAGFTDWTDINESIDPAAVARTLRVLLSPLFQRTLPTARAEGASAEAKGATRSSVARIEQDLIISRGALGRLQQPRDFGPPRLDDRRRRHLMDIHNRKVGAERAYVAKLEVQLEAARFYEAVTIADTSSVWVYSPQTTLGDRKNPGLEFVVSERVRENPQTTFAIATNEQDREKLEKLGISILNIVVAPTIAEALDKIAYKIKGQNVNLVMTEWERDNLGGNIIRDNLTTQLVNLQQIRQWLIDNSPSMGINMVDQDKVYRALEQAHILIGGSV